MDWKKYFETRNNPSNDFKKFEDQDDDDDDFWDLETFFNEFHGNKFNFHGFPPNVLKQFQDIIESMENLDENLSDKDREKFIEKYSDFRQKSDKDLDGKMYTEQLDTLLKRINPELMLKDNPSDHLQQQKIQANRKLTDEEKVWDMIHGTYKEPERVYKNNTIKKPNKRATQKTPIPRHPFSALPFHEFPPSSIVDPQQQQQSGSASKSWGKTIISIRNADGSSETRKVERTPDGSTKTTITKMDADGNSSTNTFTGTNNGEREMNEQKQQVAANESYNHDERNLINHQGYKIPCLW
jgi:hypothetical protein